MAISYKPLYITLAKKGKQIKDLNNEAGVVASTTSKFRRGESVSLQTIEKICLYLDCPIEDVVEIIPNEDKDKSS